MGATEIAIIALSSVIFLGTVLSIALLCSSCKERYEKEFELIYLQYGKTVIFTIQQKN